MDKSSGSQIVTSHLQQPSWNVPRAASSNSEGPRFPNPNPTLTLTLLHSTASPISKCTVSYGFILTPALVSPCPSGQGSTAAQPKWVGAVGHGNEQSDLSWLPRAASWMFGLMSPLASSQFGFGGFNGCGKRGENKRVNELCLSWKGAPFSILTNFQSFLMKLETLGRLCCFYQNFGLLFFVTRSLNSFLLFLLVSF